MGDPNIAKILPSPQTIEIKDNGDIIEAIAGFDQEFFNQMQNLGLKRKFIIEGRDAQSILHLVWNPLTNELYPNIGLEARGPHKEWLPLKSNLQESLPPLASIGITIDAGC